MIKIKKPLKRPSWFTKEQKELRSMKTYIENKIKKHFLPMFLVLIITPHLFTYMDRRVFRKNIEPEVLEIQKESFFNVSSLVAMQLTEALTKTTTELSQLTRMANTIAALNRDGEIDIPGLQLPETVCNFHNSSDCENESVEEYLSNAQARQIYGSARAGLRFSVMSYMHSGVVTAEGWSDLLSVKALEPFLRYYFHEQKFLDFFHNRLNIYLFEDQVHLTYPGYELDPSSPPRISAEATLTNRMREQKVAGSGDVLMRSDFMNNGLDVLEDVFYLARPLRTGSSNEPTGFVASAVVIRYSQCQNSHNIIMDREGNVLINTADPSGEAETPLNVRTMDIPSQLKTETIAFFGKDRSEDPLAPLSFSLLFTRENNTKTTLYHSVYIQQLGLLDLVPEDAMFFGSFCVHAVLKETLEQLESDNYLLYMIFAIVDILFAASIFVLISRWVKNFDNLVMNPVRQMSEKLHRIVKSAYVAGINSTKKINPDDILVKENTEIKLLHKELMDTYKAVTEDKEFLVEGDILDKTNLYIKKRYKKKHDDNILRGLRGLSDTIRNTAVEHSADPHILPTSIMLNSDHDTRSAVDDGSKSARRRSSRFEFKFRDHTDRRKSIKL